jgi:hypothetical protein
MENGMEHDALFAEGMEAFACGLLIKDCPYPRKSENGEEWVKGYYQAMHDPCRILWPSAAMSPTSESE